MQQKIGHFEKMLAISGALEICRRYFVMNMFDGALAALGVIMGMWISGVAESRVVVRTVLSAGLAMFISGFLGAYLAEKAERERKIRELEEAMFQDMKGSIYEKSSKLATLIVSLVDGLSPLIACALLIAPFALSQAFTINFTVAMLVSLIEGISMLGFLGYFLSRISGRKTFEYTAYMVLAGITSAIVIVLLGAYV